MRPNSAPVTVSTAQLRPALKLRPFSFAGDLSGTSSALQPRFSSPCPQLLARNIEASANVTASVSLPAPAPGFAKPPSSAANTKFAQPAPRAGMMGNQGSALITASPPEPRLRRPSQRPAPSRLPDRQASRSRPSCTFEVFRSSRSSPPTSFPRPPGCPPARRRLPFEVVKVPAGAQPAPQLAASPARRARRPETTTGSLGPAPQTIVVIARRTPITWHARGDAIAPSTGFSYTRPRQLRGLSVATCSGPRFDA